MNKKFDFFLIDLQVTSVDGKSKEQQVSAPFSFFFIIIIIIGMIGLTLFRLGKGEEENQKSNDGPFTSFSSHSFLPTHSTWVMFNRKAKIKYLERKLCVMLGLLYISPLSDEKWNRRTER